MSENTSLVTRGRPKAAGSEKNMRLTIYLTNDEKAQIEQFAKELGMSPTAFVKFSTFSQMKQQKV